MNKIKQWLALKFFYLAGKLDSRLPQFEDLAKDDYMCYGNFIVKRINPTDFYIKD